MRAARKIRVVGRLLKLAALLLASCFVVWLAASGALARTGVGSWRATGSQLGVRSEESVAPLVNGRVLVVHSEDQEATPTDPMNSEALATELYEPISGTWVAGPSPAAHNASTVVPLADGGALLLGEAACHGSFPRCLPTSTTYRLNASDSAWTPSAPMHEARARPAVAGLTDGRVLVAGGFGDSCTPMVALGYSCAPLAGVEIFDPAAGTWSQAPPLPEPRGGASATQLTDGSVLLLGGGAQPDHALLYQPGAKRWQILGPAPFTGARLLALPRDRAIAIGSEPEADFYGSYGGAGTRAIPVCDTIAAEIYTRADNTWSAAPPLPRHPISCSTSAVALTNGQILYTPKGASRYVLDSHQQCWTATRSPVSPHDGLLAPLPGGRALDLGGDGGTVPPAAEIYTPGKHACTVARRTRTRLFTHLAQRGTATKLATTDPYHWRATPGGQVSLVPVLDAGEAGWCMQTVTRIVTGSSISSSRACPAPTTSTGPIFAEACGDSPEEGAFVFVLTQSDVAAVSIDGGARIPTTTNATLPGGLRAASLQAPEYPLQLRFSTHCPGVTPFEAHGTAIPTRSTPGVPLASRLPRATWAHPQNPPRGVCRLDTSQLRLGTVAWEGAVATAITPVHRLLGRALVSCADTVHIHKVGEYVTTAALLNASRPGSAPPPLPDMTPLAGHPGIFRAASSDGPVLARRIPGAWVLATTDETTGDPTMPLEILQRTRVTIHVHAHATTHT
jgi:Kelch motif